MWPYVVNKAQARATRGLCAYIYASIYLSMCYVYIYIAICVLYLYIYLFKQYHTRGSAVVLNISTTGTRP